MTYWCFVGCSECATRRGEGTRHRRGVQTAKNNLQHGSPDSFSMPDPKKRREKIVEEPVFLSSFQEKKRKNSRHVETENHLAIQHLSTVKTCCIYREKSDTLPRCKAHNLLL
jgi:hypothetical protein